MQTILLELIKQLNSSVFILVGILITAFWALYKIGGIVTDFKNSKEKQKSTDDKIDSYNDKIYENFRTITDSLSDIKATTKLLYEAHLRTVKSKSPLSLTEKGEAIAKDIELNEKVNKYWDSIKEKRKNELKSNNPYDVQRWALDNAQQFFNDFFKKEEQDEIKIYAYKNGVNLLEIYPIIGVLIRDKIFDNNKL